MTPPAKDVSEWLPDKRKQLGVTQADLGELLGVAANTVARWERGERDADTPVMLRATVDELIAARNGDQGALERLDGRRTTGDRALPRLVEEGAMSHWFLLEMVAAFHGISLAEARKRAAAVGAPVMSIHREHYWGKAVAHVPHSFAKALGLPTNGFEQLAAGTAIAARRRR